MPAFQTTRRFMGYMGWFASWFTVGPLSVQAAGEEPGWQTHCQLSLVYRLMHVCQVDFVSDMPAVRLAHHARSAQYGYPFKEVCMTHIQDSSHAGQSRIGQRLHLELDAAKRQLENISPIVTIYGGARVTPADSYYDATTRLAHNLSARGIAVMSGGGPGIMEAANKGAKAGEQGLSIGLNITLAHEQRPNAYQDIELSFEHFSSRKATFCKYSEAFVVMPGGFGTLDELFEVLTLVQTGKSRAAPVILYGREFWQGLVTWMREVMVARGLVSSNEMQLFEIVDTVDDALMLCEQALQNQLA